MQGETNATAEEEEDHQEAKQSFVTDTRYLLI